jgi:hypothetical protein
MRQRETDVVRVLDAVTSLSVGNPATFVNAIA